MHNILLFIAIFLNHVLYTVMVGTIFHCLLVLITDFMSSHTNGAYLSLHVCVGMSAHALTCMSVHVCTGVSVHGCLNLNKA